MKLAKGLSNELNVLVSSPCLIGNSQCDSRASLELVSRGRILRLHKLYILFAESGPESIAGNHVVSPLCEWSYKGFDGTSIIGVERAKGDQI
jgi:hypothetical protein